jgi:hypothetical protein
MRRRWEILFTNWSFDLQLALSSRRLLKNGFNNSVAGHKSRGVLSARQRLGLRQWSGALVPPSHESARALAQSKTSRLSWGGPQTVHSFN